MMMEQKLVKELCLLVEFALSQTEMHVVEHLDILQLIEKTDDSSSIPNSSFRKEKLQ